MKPLLLLLFCCALFACKHAASENEPVIAKDTSFRLSPPDTTDDAEEDTGTTIINTEDGDTLAYTNDVLTKLLDYYPRLNSDNDIIGPDESYADEERNWANIKPEDKDVTASFGSLAGQDEYYLLYGYFLKGKNGIAKEHTRRKKLVETYRTINDIYAEINEGGTYFGHQYKRILAYAEYDIYNYINYPYYYKKDYNIAAQKKLFLQYLEQVIKDELNADKGMSPTDKKQRINDILANVNRVDYLITDYFYLKNTETFNYKYY